MRKSARRSRFVSLEQLERRSMCIVGGNNATTAEFPFAVALQTASGFQFCGGSLLDSTHVLTAAHCTSSRDITAVVNRTDLRTTAGEAITVTGIQRHPQYNSRTVDNDIAILTLSKPVSQSVPLRPAKHEELNTPGNRATVVGWGTTRFQGNTSPILRQVTVPLVSNNEANRPQSYGGLVTKNMLAAGQTGKDSCQGDSGGPLFLRNGAGELRQVGIVSWGEGCGQVNKPGIYTRVSNYYDWIYQKLRETPSPATSPATTNRFAREASESSTYLLTSAVETQQADAGSTLSFTQSTGIDVEQWNDTPTELSRSAVDAVLADSSDSLPNSSPTFEPSLIGGNDPWNTLSEEDLWDSLAHPLLMADTVFGGERMELAGSAD